MKSRFSALVVVVVVVAVAVAVYALDQRGERRPARTVGFTGTPTTEVTVAGASNPPPQPDVHIYSGVAENVLSPVVQGFPTRVYVPNTEAHTVDVIDPATYKVVDSFPVGRVPHHVTPSWDLTRLYVDNTEGNSLTVIDPKSGKPVGEIPVEDPYNLYFTLDGTKAIVVAERHRRLDFRNPQTWELIKSVPVPWPGVDHADLSADGSYLLVSTEFSGMVVKVDVNAMEVVGRAEVGGLPVDVKVKPDGSLFYVANQSRHGVSVIDSATMTEVGFIPTGRGAHGLQMSRDATSMYVSNRLAGSISLIDLATNSVVGTAQVGGSPDMMQITPDGKQLWVSNRYHASVSVVDAQTGRLLHTIKTGRGTHGLAYFPQPGRLNVGHNGVYR